MVYSDVDPSQGVITLRYWSGYDLRLNKSYEGISLKGTIAETAIRERKALLLDASSGKPVSAHTQVVPTSIDEDLKETICVPLFSRGVAFGCLYMGSRTAGSISEHHVDLASLIVDQISGSIANVELVERLRRESDLREALADVGRAANENLNMDHIYETLAQLLKRLIGYDRMVVTTVCDDDVSFERAFVAGVEVEEEPQGSVVDVPSLNTVLAGDIMGDDIGVFALGSPAPNRRMQKAGLRSWTQVPLGDPTTPSGSLSLRNLTPHKYSLRDVEFLERVASLISPVLQNAKLLAKTQDDAKTLAELTVSLQASAERRQILAEIGRTVSSTQDVAEIFDEFARLASKLVPFESISYADIDVSANSLTLRYVYGERSPVGRFDVPVDLDGTIAEQAIELKHPFVVRATKDRPISQTIPSFPTSADEEVAEAVCVPLVTQGEIFGCLYFSSNKLHTFDIQHIEMIELITDQVSGAIANARLNDARLSAERDRVESESHRRELAALNEQKSEFLSTVSHELKTPLTSLVAFADILSKNTSSNLSDRQLKQLEVMQRSSRRLDVLINDLVDVSQIDGGKLKIEKDKFLVSGLVEEIRLAFDPILDPKQQTSSVKNNAEGAAIIADRHRIAQLLTNLMSNSSKYSPEGTDISVSIDSDGDQLEIVVSDNGIGMDSITLENMFTPFFRSDDEKTQSVAGTGLGLAIVQKIVELHDGTVTATSDLGVGTTVRVVLPGLITGPAAAEGVGARRSKPVFGFRD
jgi:signal transduction histidine kinase